MIRDDEDEEWIAEAHVSFSRAAEGEFARLKKRLKQKAEEASLSRHRWLLWQLKGFLVGLYQRAVRLLRRHR